MMFFVFLKSEKRMLAQIMLAPIQTTVTWVCIQFYLEHDDLGYLRH